QCLFRLRRLVISRRARRLFHVREKRVLPDSAAADRPERCWRRPRAQTKPWILRALIINANLLVTSLQEDFMYPSSSSISAFPRIEALGLLGRWLPGVIIALSVACLLPSRAGGQSVSSRGATYIEPGTIDVGDFVPISVWYSGGNARAPMLSKITPTSREEWLTDLRQIKDLGYNTVRTWVEWSKCEPREGHYDFRNLELLLELAEEVGLRVFIQLYLDSAPDWIGKKYPDAYFTAQNGEQMKPQSAPGYSIDHPGVREAARQFMTRAAEVASRSEAHFGWDIWSEPHLINWASAPWMSNAHFGFNPHTQARFREWLKRKYDGQIEALNASWYRTFEEWDDVEAPRLRTILSFTDYV